MCGVGEAIRFHLQVFFSLISVLPLFDQLWKSPLVFNTTLAL